MAQNSEMNTNLLREAKFPLQEKGSKARCLLELYAIPVVAALLLWSICAYLIYPDISL